MTKAESLNILLELSREGRAWAETLHIPALLAIVFWHLPQPKWVKKVFGPKDPSV